MFITEIDLMKHALDFENQKPTPQAAGYKEQDKLRCCANCEGFSPDEYSGSFSAGNCWKLKNETTRRGDPRVYATSVCNLFKL